MASWEELSVGCLRSAKLLIREGYFRSSISRAYYAAYCAISSALAERGVSFAHGWQNPSHEQIPGLVVHNLTVSREERRRANQFIRILRQAREDSDYRPGVTVDRALAITCLHLADRIMAIMRISDD